MFEITDIDQIQINGEHYVLNDVEIQVHKSYSELYSVPNGGLKTDGAVVLLEIDGDVLKVGIEQSD